MKDKTINYVIKKAKSGTFLAEIAVVCKATFTPDFDGRPCLRVVSARPPCNTLAAVYTRVDVATRVHHSQRNTTRIT